MNAINEYIAKIRALIKDHHKEFLRFGVVGTSGVLINTGILFLLHTIAGMHYLLAAAIATETAIITNFLGNHHFTFTKKNTTTSVKDKFILFQTISLFTLALTLGILWLLTNTFGEQYVLVWNLIAIAITFVINFALNRVFTWGKTKITPKVKHIATGLALVGVAVLIAATVQAAPSNNSLNHTNSENLLDTFAITEATNTTNQTETNGQETNTTETNTTEVNTTQSNTTETNTTEANSSTNTTENSDNAQDETTNSTSPTQTCMGTIIIDATPQATITINETAIGTTPIAQQRTCGKYTIMLQADSYQAYSVGITLENNTQTINQTLTALNQNTETNTSQENNTDDAPAQTTDTETNNTNSPTETNSTNTNNTETNTTNDENSENNVLFGAQTSVSSQGGKYYFHETDNETFTIHTNTDTTVTWTADGKTLQSTQGTTHTIHWMPGVTYSANTQEGKITASTGKQSYTWDVVIDDTINPFFSSTDYGPDVVGAKQTVLHIFTDDAVLHPTHVRATLHAGSQEYEVNLEKGFVNQEKQETDWQIPLGVPPMQEGNNIVSKITITDEQNNTQEYAVSEQRSHYVQESRKSSGGGGRGGRYRGPAPFEPTVKYAFFTTDIQEIGNSTHIQTDLETFENDITRAWADIETPSGTMDTVELSLIRGDNTYGTWDAQYVLHEQGRYMLTAIHAQGEKEENVTLNASAQTYAANSSAIANYTLELITIFVNTQRTVNASAVIITVDARDAKGITNITGNVRVKNDTVHVPFERTEGDANYGTWTGIFHVTHPDSTYTISTITLRNQDEEKTYNVENRSIYVQPELPAREEDANETSEPITLSTLSASPLAPAAVGAVLFTTTFTVAGLAGRRKKRYA